MNIREMIEKLQEMAGRLPDGLDSEVQVHICNQNEPGVMTPSLEVDTMWTYNQTGALTGGCAIVQGHPHRDKGSSTTTPATAEIDDLVEKWAADLRGVDSPAGAAGVVMMTSPQGEEYLLLPSSDGKFVKLALLDGAVRYLPGSAEAVEAGCLCDPERNNYGRGRWGGDEVQMVIKDGCPLHPKIEIPVDPDTE